MADLGVLAAAVDEVTGALGRNPAPDALEARRMQALSLAVHIPIVCFGIAFPAMFLFVHGLYLRTGEPAYKALAKRWSKVALTIFAVGVVTGTILSFEFGLLWPDFMATFGEVFGLAFGLEGVSFFVEAIFIAIYVYGWDRLPPRTHFLTGVPVVISGFAGSFNVIAVNGWMNNPGGFTVVDGRVTEPEAVGGAAQRQPVARARAHVRGGLPRRRVHRGRHLRLGLAQGPARPLPPHGPRGRAQLRRAGRAGPGDRRRLGRAPGSRVPAGQARRDGRPLPHDGGRALHARRVLRHRDQRGPLRDRDPVPAVRARGAQPERDDPGAGDRAPQDRPPINYVRFAFQTMVGIGTALALLGVFFALTWWRKRRLPRSKWFYRAVMAAGPLSLVALICGWITTEVGRQPWIVYETMRVSDAVTASDGLELGFGVLVAVYVGVVIALWWLIRRLTARPPHTEVGAEPLRPEARARR